MQRIMVIGPCGSGKSTVARRLGEILTLPVFHMDVFGWQRGWIETSRSQVADAVDRVLELDRWIIDGNDSGTMPQRLALADTVVFLDFPLLRCAWRVLRRVATLSGTTRPDMGEGCPERLDFGFMLYVLRWNSGPRHKVLARVRGHEHKLSRLTNQRDLNRWLEQVG